MAEFNEQEDNEC